MDVVIVTMLFGVLGIMIGWKVGTVWGESAEDDHTYWMRNLIAVMVGSLVAFVVLITGLITLVGLGVGLIGGAIAGLKMGYGKSVGIWQKHDRLFRVNRDQLAAAEADKDAKEKGMTRKQRAERELVSAGPAKKGRDGDGAGAGASDDNGKGR